MLSIYLFAAGIFLLVTFLTVPAIIEDRRNGHK